LNYKYNSNPRGLGVKSLKDLDYELIYGKWKGLSEKVVEFGFTDDFF
jgi:hypothetical protein